jgi:hypothetical protein
MVFEDRENAAFFHDIGNFFGPRRDDSGCKIACDKYWVSLMEVHPETGKYFLRSMRSAR